MRPGQNKRPRGRNNNGNGGNRKGPNPLTRSYESNGPDVKVRGTAQHIAEKYLQLARDAQSSGDPVMAESYLQHAEHYYRLIAAAQAAQQAQMGFRPSVEVEFEEEEDDPISDRFASVAERLPPQQFPAGHQQAAPSASQGSQPENAQERPNYNQDRSQERSDRQERPQNNRQPRQDRAYGADRNDRQQAGDRNNGFRDGRRFRESRMDQPGELRPIDGRSQEGRAPDSRQDGRMPERQPSDRGHEKRQFDTRSPEPRQQEVRPGDLHVNASVSEAHFPPVDSSAALPAFITAPARSIASEAALPAVSSMPELPLDQSIDPGYHLRSRRRRRPRVEEVADGAAPSDESFAVAPITHKQDG